MEEGNAEPRVDANPNPCHEETQCLDSGRVQEVKKKRGRKSKKEKEEMEKKKMLDATVAEVGAVSEKRPIRKRKNDDGNGELGMSGADKPYGIRGRKQEMMSEKVTKRRAKVT